MIYLQGISFGLLRESIFHGDELEQSSRAANIVNSSLVFVLRLLRRCWFRSLSFFLPKKFTFYFPFSPVAQKDLLFVLEESFAHDLLIPSKDDISYLARLEWVRETARWDKNEANYLGWDFICYISFWLMPQSGAHCAVNGWGSGAEGWKSVDVRTAKQFMSGFSHISKRRSQKGWRKRRGEKSQLNHLATKPNEVDVNKIAFHKFSFGKRKLPFWQQKRS